MYTVLPELIPAEVARELGSRLAELPAAQWQPGREGSGEQAGAVKHNLQLSREHALSREVLSCVMQALDKTPEFLAAALPRRVFPPRVNRYDPEHPSFGWHVDGAIRLVPPSGQPLRTDLSCTVFLCDPDTYEGGELEIQDSAAVHRLKLAAGHAVLYPATTLHRVAPVTRGARLATFFWVESLVGDDTDRRLLHMLDTQLVALRRRHGESDETTALTAVYHHLLRRWSVA